MHTRQSWSGSPPPFDSSSGQWEFGVHTPLPSQAARPDDTETLRYWRRWSSAAEANWPPESGHTADQRPDRLDTVTPRSGSHTCFHVPAPQYSTPRPSRRSWRKPGNTKQTGFFSPFFSLRSERTFTCLHPYEIWGFRNYCPLEGSESISESNVLKCGELIITSQSCNQKFHQLPQSARQGAPEQSSQQLTLIRVRAPVCVQEIDDD